jgi:hypothetical protein
MGRAGNIISGKVIRHRANNGKEHLFPLNGNHAIRVRVPETCSYRFVKKRVSFVEGKLN